MPLAKLFDSDTAETQPVVDDNGLMTAIADDDEEAFNELIERYWSSLLWYASGQLVEEDDAEDVAQEVFIRLWESRKRWDSHGSVKAFLFRVARNLVISRVRHQRVKQRVEPELVYRAARSVTPIDVAAHREFQAAFQQVLSGLPERRREAFILVRTLGLGLQEAADVMGVTRRTVANHVYLAVTDLQSGLRSFLG